MQKEKDKYFVPAGALADKNDGIQRQYSNKFIELIEEEDLQQFSKEEVNQYLEKRKAAKSKKQKKIKYIKRTETNSSGGDSEQFTYIDRKKTKKDYDFLIQCLREHFILFSMKETELEQICEKMNLAECGQGSYLMREGDEGNLFFIVNSGQMAQMRNNHVLRKIGVGKHLGERSLLYNQPRQLSIKCLTKCEVWYIDRWDFNDALEKIIKKNAQENRKFLNKIPFFQMLQEGQQDQLTLSTLSCKYKAGQVVVREKVKQSSLFIVKSGCVIITKRGQLVREVKPGEFFGERNIYSKQGDRIQAQAEEETVCLRITRNKIFELFGESLEMCMLRNIHQYAIDRTKYLSKLSNVYQTKIIDAMIIKSGRKGKVILKKGSKKGKSLLLILQGNLVKPNGEIFAKKSYLVGEESLYNYENPKDSGLFQEHMSLSSNGMISFISKKNLQKIFGGKTLKEFIEQQNAQIINIEDISDTPDLNYLSILRELGFGQYGQVYLAMDGQEGLYAIKMIHKKSMRQSDFDKYVKRERDILQFIDYPLIQQYKGCYQDENAIYIFTEFLQGMELFDAIRDLGKVLFKEVQFIQGLITIKESLFYVAQILLQMEYLHFHQIVYRDLKPENIIVKANGYLSLIDMGTAKFLQRKSPKDVIRTFTVLGSPHYLAPEIMEGKGYSFEVDIYSLGVCFYEFVCGFLPFGEELDDPYEIYKIRMDCDYVSFPENVKNKKAKKQIRKWLSREPHKRMKNFGKIKASKLFNSIDWKKLENEQMIPFYKPPEEKLNIQQDEIDSLADEKKPFLEFVEKAGKDGPRKHDEFE